MVVTLFPMVSAARDPPCCPELTVLACSPGLVGEVAGAGEMLAYAALWGLLQEHLVPSGQSEWVLIPWGDPWPGVLSL